MGQYYLFLLTFNVDNFINSKEINPEPVQKCIVQFPELNIKWPVIQDIKGYEDAVNLFKLGNT